jgi:hypothetical protein
MLVHISFRGLSTFSKTTSLSSVTAAFLAACSYQLEAINGLLFRVFRAFREKQIRVNREA